MPTNLSTEALPVGSGRSAIRINLRDLGTLFGLVAIAAIFSAMAPSFLSVHNLLNILQQSSINACVAIGMTLVIISGGIDLSVGPTAALSAVITATMMGVGVPFPAALLGGLLIGMACGAVNGLLISLAGLQPFIVTLGTLSLYRALALIFTGGNPILGLPAAFRGMFNSGIGPIPMPVVIVGVLSVIFWFVLRKTPLGEYILAVGGNEEAARIAGVPIVRTKVVTYMISGSLAFVAGMILIGRLGAAEPILGNLWELDAIAAAAIGGASLMGGKGSIVGTLLGALVLGSMRDGLTLMNVQAFYQLLATGIIIIAAMLVDRFTRGRMMESAPRELYAVGARLRMLRPTLTTLENRIVDAVLDQTFDAATSLRAVANTAGVSDPMVVKTAKKLGFEGFRDFREQVSAYRRLPSASLHKEISADDRPADILSKLFNTAVQALQETLAILDVATFEAVVDTIHSASQRDLYGLGGSAQIARDVAHKFLRIGLRCAVHDDAHMMLMSASLLRPGDVAIAFSHSGRSTAVIDAVREAHGRGAAVIAITNFAQSPLCDVADLVLCSTARGSPLLGENAAARVAQLTILDAVFAAIAQKDLDRAELNLELTTAAVREKREK